jgi:hypothetical protein
MPRPWAWKWLLSQGFGRGLEQGFDGPSFEAFRQWNKIRCAAFEAEIRRRACADVIIIHRRMSDVTGALRTPVWPWCPCHGVSRRIAR